MDARDQLRRYLEQRREMGEQELVLDSLSVEEAMALVAGRGKREEQSESPPQPMSSISSASRGEMPSAVANDWRTTLRAAGAAPDTGAETAIPLSSKSVPTPSGELFAGSLERVETLEEIASLIASCKKCPLYKTATNPVPGEGHPRAKLMCVGEAPGATEDETGRPFVGAAGQLLTKILAAIDLPREQVYICNVLKHRPPGNRNPLPDEVTACSPYLIRQIELIKPKVILALGTFAAQTLLNTKTAIGKLRGSVHEYHGVPLVVTYHPAALLRNPGWKRPTWEDVQLARRILDRSNAGA